MGQFESCRRILLAFGLMKCAPFVSAMAAVVVLGCSREAPIPPPAPNEQDLNITIGGFIQGGNEQQKMDGVCNTDDTRHVLNCDIYNGLPGWRVTELVIKLAWAPYSDDNVRDYRQRVSILPQTTASLHVLLGTQLPADTKIRGKTLRHYHWLIIGAKAVPAQSAPS